ncbi:hypothetical protein C0J52_17932 [Blattella germanica]|nr:hypothetical protein C0J52_17932 [Blattella germanica]
MFIKPLLVSLILTLCIIYTVPSPTAEGFRSFPRQLRSIYIESAFKLLGLEFNTIYKIVLIVVQAFLEAIQQLREDFIDSPLGGLIPQLTGRGFNMTVTTTSLPTTEIQHTST